MKLKKLTLHGFKSFADKTEFDFQDGITVIVGPNGCGKSNVVDAVKWVLGEQRPSSLRGKEMQDVIFSGTDSRKGVGFAEVSLLLDNGMGILPIDYAEVQITRRLYRSGESEYLINGNPARLRDVRELLMDSGGGPGALTIMEQGNIDRLLRADPQERRVVFEEAAGIAKYRARRKETERKLERTTENLARLRDILGEYETRERSLKIQAGKARRWREMTDDLKRKLVAGALARYRELSLRRSEAQAGLADVLRLEREAHAALDAAMDDGEGRRRELDALRDQASRTEAEMAALVAEGRAAEEKQLAREREAVELAERAEVAEREGGAAGERAVALRAELSSGQEEIERARRERGQRQASLAAAEERHAALERSVEQLRRQREKLDLDRTEAFLSETRARNEEAAGEAELRGLSARLARLEERERLGAAECEALERERAAAAVDVRSGEADLRALEERHAAAEEGAREARLGAERASEEMRRRAGEAAGLSARRDLLAKLVAEGAGLGAGAKALLDAGRAGSLEGVRGTLADLVGNAGEEAAALDQALGELAAAVVVDTTDQALAAIAWLKEGRRGRARILPLDRTGSAPLPSRFSALESEIAPAVGALLRGTRVVATVEEAHAIDSAARVIVLSGEEFEPSGALVGGTGDAGAGLVLRRSEWSAVVAKVRTAEKAREKADARVEAARGRAQQWEETLEELRPLLREGREELRRAGERFAAAQNAATSRAAELDLDRAEQGDVVKMLEEFTTRHEEARGRCAVAERVRCELEAEQRELQEALSRAGREREEAASARTEAKVEAARWSEKAEAAEAKERTLAAMIERTAQEAEQRAAEARTCRERRSACLDEVELLARLRVEREATLQELARAAERSRGAARAAQQGMEQGERHLKALREAHDRHRAELETHRMREHEIRLRIETLWEQVKRDHGLDLAAEGGAPSVEAASDPEALEAEIAELRDRLERLGNVNHTAVDDLQEVETKLGFLRREEADLVGADRQLRETIEKIDEVCVTRFTETFASVQEQFHIVFRKLFGGGKAEIYLENPEQVLESGIEIRVRPPGKDLRNLALLSGGEKSLTTVALLFSIYQTKPPPFCLLDEVDAALDESNTVRMCEMLKEFATRGQFLVITHARATMTVADTLYGVTMPEAGISRRVAVRFADIEAGRVVGLN